VGGALLGWVGCGWGGGEATGPICVPL
jgi:hypothetical protein